MSEIDSWYCDKCGEVIDSVERGYVLWNRDKDGKHYNFQIIHQRQCDDNSSPYSAALSDYVGYDGITRLLAFISAPHFDEGVCKIKDMDEYADFFRRVQVPFYEAVRRIYEKPEVKQELKDSGATEVYPYLTSTMKQRLDEESPD